MSVMFDSTQMAYDVSTVAHRSNIGLFAIADGHPLEMRAIGRRTGNTNPTLREVATCIRPEEKRGPLYCAFFDV